MALMRAIHIITTGGTIASRIDPKTGGAVPAVTASELVAMSPAVKKYADEIRVTDFGLYQSWNLGPDLMARIAESATAALRDEDVAGVVVTHGTDTMEETAFALDLLVDSPKPVVITGAMRNASDAAGELLDELTYLFNRARQSAITAEIADISGGKAALE